MGGHQSATGGRKVGLGHSRAIQGGLVKSSQPTGSNGTSRQLADGSSDAVQAPSSRQNHRQDPVQDGRQDLRQIARSPPTIQKGSDNDPTSIRHPTRDPTRIRHRSDIRHQIDPTLIRHRSDIDPPSTHRSDIDPTSIRHRSDIDPTSIRHPTRDPTSIRHPTTIRQGIRQGSDRRSAIWSDNDPTRIRHPIRHPIRQGSAAWSDWVAGRRPCGSSSDCGDPLRFLFRHPVDQHVQHHHNKVKTVAAHECLALANPAPQKPKSPSFQLADLPAPSHKVRRAGVRFDSHALGTFRPPLWHAGQNGLGIWCVLPHERPKLLSQTQPSEPTNPAQFFATSQNTIAPPTQPSTIGSNPTGCTPQSIMMELPPNPWNSHLNDGSTRQVTPWTNVNHPKQPSKPRDGPIRQSKQKPNPLIRPPGHPQQEPAENRATPVKQSHSLSPPMFFQITK